jgi:PilZ domain
VQTNPNSSSGGFTGTSERRAHPRCRPQPFAYVKVGEHNGGIVMDASENGLQMAAANSLAPEKVVRLSLQLGASAEPTEVEARVVWLSESRKTGGFEFVSLTDEAREQIREWLNEDGAKAEFSGPKAVPSRVRDHRIAEVRAEARTNGADLEVRTPAVSDPAPRGFERMFPPEGGPIPPSPVREVEPRNGRSVDDRPTGTGIGRDPAPFKREPVGGRLPGSGPFQEREPFRPPQNEARYPARAIFSDSPFHAPPIAPRRWTNARMGLLTGVVMVICFAVGIIAGRVWMGRWPQGWNLQKLTGGTSEPAPTPPPPAAATTAPTENPTANPEANSRANPDANGSSADANAKATPDADGSSADAPASTPPAVATPAPPESSGKSSSAGAAPISSAKENTTAASEEPLPPELAGNSILATAPAAGSPSVRVSLPQEPLTASASVAIGVRRSALLPPEPGPVSIHRPERLEFGKIIAQVPDVLAPNIPPMGDPIVVLRVTIGEQGEIKSLVPIRGRDELIPKAERLVREWQQFPARLGGQPIESTEEIILTFRTGP